MKQVPDARAFLIGLYELNDQPRIRDSGRKVELVDVKINGDTAQGSEVITLPDGSTISEDVGFTKINGSWKIDSVLVY
jgi:hypothetical protein